MSTAKQRKAFMLMLEADLLEEQARRGFHSIELPFWPPKPSDKYKLTAEAKDRAVALREEAKKLMPEAFDEQARSETGTDSG